MIKSILIIAIILLNLSCNTDNATSENQSAPISTYFPPINSSVWENKTPASLSWDATKINNLLAFLELKNSKSFIILVDGKIVIEHYMNGHNATDNRYWASAGKTLTATIFGIAEQEGIVNQSDKVSKTLGTGWTSLPINKEDLITNRNLLTMTSGLNETNGDCVTPNCLIYTADAGTRWAYHNVYVKLQNVVANASGQTFTNYFNTKLRDQIGMDGVWFQQADNIIYTSTARSAARFGLLILNNGKWQNNQIVNPTYLTQSTTTSQTNNQAYGYLWWINGENTYRLPGYPLQFNGSLISEAPADMYMAMGKNDQKIYIIPSKKMVVVRFGDVADTNNPNFGLSNFDSQLWTKIRALYL